jgi:hypothetical protein
MQPTVPREITMKNKFELFENDSRADEPTREEYKRFKQREHNDRQKQIAKTIGENFAAYSLLAIMALLIGSIWTEASIFSNWRKFIGDALVTIVLYVLADICASHIGTEGGKLDDEYISNHETYLVLRERVRKIGVELMNAFCDWQIEVEYEYYMRRRCRDLKIDYKEYVEVYSKKNLFELREMFPIETIKEKDFKRRAIGTYHNVKTVSKADKIFQLSLIKPIELTPEILMTDGKVRNTRGGVSISGEEYSEQQTKGAKHIIATILFGLLSASLFVDLVKEFSIAMLIYTIFKIALMLYRMFVSYNRGIKSYSSVDPKSLQDKIKYLYLYLEFIDKKIYLSLKDKYNIMQNEFAEDKRTDTTDEVGTGGDPRELGDNSASV